jgi:putative endonuclease
MEMEDNKKSYVYMMTNYWGNVLYIGSTADLKSRVYQHKKGLIPGFTQKYKVCKLVYFEEHLDVGSAQAREKQLKGKSREKKNQIVETMNLEWKELSLPVA